METFSKPNNFKITFQSLKKVFQCSNYWILVAIVVLLRVFFFKAYSKTIVYCEAGDAINRNTVHRIQCCHALFTYIEPLRPGSFLIGQTYLANILKY